MPAAKIAVITGGSRGLGKAAVLALAKRGVNSIFTYNTNPDSAQAVIKEVKALGADAQALPLNVSEPAGIDEFVTKLTAALAQWNAQKFDYLINNAGIGSHSTVADTSEAVIDNLFNIHYKSVFLLTQKTLNLINDGGRILNVSTGLARFTNPGFVAYASMKGAIEVFTRYLAQEVGPRGIRVNVIAPGATETDFGGGVVRDNKTANKMISDRTALGRPGQPDEIGEAVATILADGFGWVNGQRIEVSGGQNL